MRKFLPAAVALLIFCAGLLLIWQRNGVLAWGAALFGVLLLVKSLLRPGRRDLLAGVVFVLLFALTWVGTVYYVRGVWESGEVVELQVQTGANSHYARLWVADADNTLLIYYDADAAVAEAILRGAPLQVTRNGQVLTIAETDVARVDEVAPERVDRLYALWLEKYGDRNNAADIYFGLLGRARDRVALLLTLRPAQ